MMKEKTYEKEALFLSPYAKKSAESAGRLREDKIFDYKFIGLSHNTLRGAAGGAVLLAELLAAKKYI